MTKLTKKALSLAVAGFVAFSSTFSGAPLTASAKVTEVTKDVAAIDADDTYKDSYQVKLTKPETRTGTLYAYAYYNVYAADGTTVTKVEKPLGIWPGKAVTASADGTYSFNVPTNSAEVNLIFINLKDALPDKVSTDKDGNEYYDVKVDDDNRYPADLKGGVTISGNSSITLTGTNKDSYEAVTTPLTVATPTVTPTTTPTNTPVVTTSVAVTASPSAVPTVEPVKGPQVTVDKANGTSYDEKEDGDTLPVKISLADGATSASYSIDNGPATPITEDTTVNIGEGKIANSEILLTVTSTDGKTTNVQNFRYYKKTKVTEGNKTVAAKVFTKALAIVKAAANEDTKLQVSLDTSACEAWNAEGVNIYCYAYYDVDDATTTTGKKTVEPLDYWPGTKMDRNGTLSTISVPSEIGSAKIIFTALNGERGKDPVEKTDKSGYYYDCDKIKVGQIPSGYKKGPNGEDLKNEKGESIPVDGEVISNDTTFAINSTATELTATVVNTPAPATPTATVPTATPTAKPTATPAMQVYFGAELSAPQYNTTKQTLKAVAVNQPANAEYTFTVDDEIISTDSTKNTVTWDPSALTEGKHKIAVTVKAGKVQKTETKNYTIVAAPVSTPIATPEITATPVVTPEVTPAVTPIVTPEVTPTATATATATAPAITATPAAATTTTPVITPTTVPTAVPTTTAPVTVTNGGIVSNPAITTTTSAVAGKITFNKIGKTVGETVKITAKVTSGSAVYYTFTATKSGKTTKIATKTKKSTVNWVPTAKGTYTIKVTLFDKNKKQIGTLTSTYKVKTRVITIKKFKTNKKSGQKKGTKVVISANAATTRGSLRYKFVVKNSKGKAVLTKKYSKKKSVVWKAKKKGTYTLNLFVKNGKGVEVSKTKTFKIK